LAALLEILRDGRECQEQHHRTHNTEQHKITMSTAGTNIPLQAQFAESATHTPTNLQNFNDTHQQEQQSQQGGQNEKSTDDGSESADETDESDQPKRKKQKRKKVITNKDRVDQNREREIRRAIKSSRSLQEAEAWSPMLPLPQVL
jgi:hypothetical protein